MYLATLAPGVTFWDAGELIAAAHGWGIPHPPGTPLWVTLARAIDALAGAALGTARAVNLLSAVSTAAAGGLTAWLVARGIGATARATWSGIVAALCAGCMTTAWANATETEVYAVSLLHAMLMLAAAWRAGDGDTSPRRERWLLVLCYLIALAPALHLSALVAVPAAMMLASHDAERARRRYVLLLVGGAFLAAAGVGRMSAPLVAAGVLAMLVAAAARDRGMRAAALAPVALGALATSALAIMLMRARLDPPLDQGAPATLSALADVVARRQYAVPGLWPRQAPLWLQVTNLFQYADWQVALDWGRGIYTTPLRVLATVLFAALAIVGLRRLWRAAPRLAAGTAMLLACGTLGVALYLNLRLGATFGGDVLGAGLPHEPRDRDYFFVLGFWAWGVLAGYGAMSLSAAGWRRAIAPACVALLLAGNWRTADRTRAPDATAARTVAEAMLGAAPPRALLFTAGDNDSYPLWYLQQVEGRRPDVQLVTLPMLPAGWYRDELRRRTPLAWTDGGQAPFAQREHEVAAARIANAARAAGRPVAASLLLEPRERLMLGGGWHLRGAVLVSTRAAGDSAERVVIEPAGALAVETVAPPLAPGGPIATDGVPRRMLSLLRCRAIGAAGVGAALRDSLETTCNLR